MSVIKSNRVNPITIEIRHLGPLFGGPFSSLREATGHSVEEAAHLAGMETADWAAVEAGGIPRPEVLLAMAAAAGIPSGQIGLLVDVCQASWKL